MKQSTIVRRPAMIRRGRGHSMKRTFCHISLFLSAALPLVLGGCGGGGGGTPGLNAVVPTIPIHWAARSRQVNGPSSALSVAVSLQSSTLSTTEATLSADRVTAPAAYLANYTASQAIVPGPYVLTANFHSGAGSTGAIVASAQAKVVVNAKGQLTNGSGTPIDVDATTSLQSISVMGGQTITAGQTATVVVTAFDSFGNVFPLTPGSVFLHLVSGAAYVTQHSNGDLTGVSPGPVSLNATVDGFTTPTAMLTVVGPPITPRSLTLSTNALVQNPVSGLFYATVPSTGGANGNCVVEINPVTGNITRSLFAGSEPTALAISDDGSTLYVGLNGTQTIGVIATNSLTETATIPLTQSGVTITDIKVQPGSTSVIAITTQDVEDTGNTGPIIIANGVTLPNRLGTYQGQVLAWASPSLIYAYDNTDSGYSLIEGSVNSQGATLSTSIYGRFSGTDTVIKKFGTRIYGSDGNIIDAATAAHIGQFPVPGGLIIDNDIAVDLNAGNAVVAFGAVDESLLNFGVYSLSTYLPVTAFSIPNVLTPPQSTLYGPTAISGLCRWGAHGLAFRSPSSVYFIDNALGF
jgi:hypothetical protein